MRLERCAWSVSPQGSSFYLHFPNAIVEISDGVFLWPDSFRHFSRMFPLIFPAAHFPARQVMI
jgi:hypothetical protein